MFTRGNAKHPCTRLTSIRGFAVRPIRPYASICPTANPCIRLQYPHGRYGEPIETIRIVLCWAMVYFSII